ncbi:hypothetical protein [Streptomyces sp. NRRL S-1022]|uniref:hypothetical protein n=1 Tax=Streptomyces sp. NRRL S-1022 TaxID=1463880 RepID=UPI0004BE6E14|nr:hypothetical protein [Streptomyces sp. NRRL S-1022]
MPVSQVAAVFDGSGRFVTAEAVQAVDASFAVTCPDGTHRHVPEGGPPVVLADRHHRRDTGQPGSLFPAVPRPSGTCR